ncbi:MAG: DUF4129 domain-containing protein [Ktedonobacteraceae bacterium]|nr:DUF4129 domain-containing protein [Ktedonobacteraceae bacterium]
MTSPSQHASPLGENNASRAASERQQEDSQEIGGAHLSITPSWGERALPLLFAALEACWVNGILIGFASTGFFGMHAAVIPLWSSFVVLMGATWLVRYLERHDSATGQQHLSGQLAGSHWLYVLLAAVLLLIIWSSVYATSAFFLDPRWLLSLMNDLLLLSPLAYHVLGTVLITGYLCWRGARIARFEIEPARVYRTLCLGAVIILAVILILAASHTGNEYTLSLLLLIPLFLSLALMAHALASTVFVRRMYAGRLQGSIGEQERSLFMAVSSVGAVLFLLALLAGLLAGPSFLVDVQRFLAPAGVLYDWLVQGLAHLAVLVLTPVFWLLDALHLQIQLPRQRLLSSPVAPSSRPATPPEAVILAAAILKVALPIILIALCILLIWLALRRRRVRLERRERDQDVHESLWSWQLFWNQLWTLLLALWRRFFAHAATQPVSMRTGEVEMGGEPAARSIREIYRALLKATADRGYARRKDETPHEFRHRLKERQPQLEPQLEILTDAYTVVRYGQHVPDAAGVAEAQQSWLQLQQKMQ